jgi:phage gp36-like protein
MYADLQLMRRLVRNVQNVRDEDLQAFAQVAEAEIDSVLSTTFELPLRPVGDGYPPPLPTVAAMLGAALLEANAFSLSNLGATENPYARQLAERANGLLQAIVSGSVVLPGQKRVGGRPSASAADRSQRLVRQLRQFRKTGSV